MVPAVGGWSRKTRAQLEVLLAALAFAISVPAGKALLREVPPLALSGGLYLSAGLFCAATLAIRKPYARSAGLRGREWAWLSAAVLSGGVLGPIALFVGLQSTSGYTAGLLLNLEAVFTLSLGALLYGERVGVRGTAGILLILLGAGLISVTGGGTVGAGRLMGPLLVIAACLFWGLDNNFTQRVSLRDARQIVAIKGLIGGATSMVLAFLAGDLRGSAMGGAVVWIALVGIASYGLSIVLFIRGLRELGVVYTGALFALAPGFAAVLSWSFLREPVSPAGLLALAGMTAGALLLTTDVHAHEHTHEAIEHAHEHEHDEHHQHEHLPGELEQVPHAHWHRHEVLTHFHRHAHDAHHRHSHKRTQT